MGDFVDCDGKADGAETEHFLIRGLLDEIAETDMLSEAEKMLNIDFDTTLPCPAAIRRYDGKIDLDIAMGMRRNGVSDEDIGKRFGCARQSVWKALRNAY